MATSHIGSGRRRTVRAGLFALTVALLALGLAALSHRAAGFHRAFQSEVRNYFSMVNIVTVALTWFSVESIALPRLIDAQWPRWLSFLLLVPFVSAPFILILGVTPTRSRRD